ncbi:transposase [Streptomyces sp. NPDC015127]|uniref:transposase n=1 Tax=Streptomyces sp. NPDC015127 TaxID=3364939 RepID=UPI0036FBE42E
MPSADAQWAWIEPLLPDRAPRRGGRWRDHRKVIDAIAWKYRTGSPCRSTSRAVRPGCATKTVPVCNQGRISGRGPRTRPVLATALRRRPGAEPDFGARYDLDQRLPGIRHPAACAAATMRSRCPRADSRFGTGARSPSVTSSASRRRSWNSCARH